MPCMGRPARPPTPPSASPHLNLRGLVFNFILIKVKKFLLLFLLSVADFLARTKSFIDIDYEQVTLLSTREKKIINQST
jgi:hypothetical protein